MFLIASERNSIRLPAVLKNMSKRPTNQRYVGILVVDWRMLVGKRAALEEMNLSQLAVYFC